MAVQGDWEEMARKELDCDKKTSCVIWSDSDSVVYKPFDWQCLGGATGHCACGNLENFSDSLHSRRRTHPGS
jgi:hypothetical protein